MKKYPSKKLKKEERPVRKDKSIYRAWGLATRLKRVKTKEKRK